MRWDELFDDLEAQLEHGLASDELELRAEDERLRLGRLSLRDRLVALTADAAARDAAARGGGTALDGGDARDRRVLALRLRSGSLLRVAVATVGRDWLVGDARGDASPAGQLLVPFSAIGSVVLGRAAVAASLAPAAPAPRLTDRLGIAFVLRDLCRRRSAVRVTTADGEAHGTIDRVGRDHLDLAVHEPGSLRRERDVVEYRIVAFDGLVSVRL